MNRTTNIKLICALLVIGVGLIGFNGVSQAAAQKREAKKIAAYYCVMDPEVKASKPGACPKCGMALREANEQPATDAPPRIELKHSRRSGCDQGFGKSRIDSRTSRSTIRTDTSSTFSAILLRARQSRSTSYSQRARRFVRRSRHRFEGSRWRWVIALEAT